MSDGPQGRFQARLPSGRHGLSPEQVAEHQRLRLLAAAGEVLRTRGFDGTTTRAISRRAGVSNATFYVHFANADACLLAAHQMAADTLLEIVSSACPSPVPRSDRVRAAIEAAIGFLVLEPTFARLFCADLAAGVPPVFAARERLLDRLASLFCPNRERRAEEGSRTTPRAEAHLAAATIALVGDRIVGGELEALPGLGPELAALLAGPGATSRV